MASTFWTAERRHVLKWAGYTFPVMLASGVALYRKNFAPTTVDVADQVEEPQARARPGSEPGGSPPAEYGTNGVGGGLRDNAGGNGGGSM